MKKYCVLFNSASDNYHGEENARRLLDIFKGEEFSFFDVRKVESQEEFVKEHKKETIVLCGGDGTLSHFVNGVKEKDIPEDILFFPCGTGNDFFRDINEREKSETKVVPLKKYISGLPTATIKGVEYKFFNGIGYGIDGYCCEEADRIREKSNKPINYTKIAIIGLLFKFKPRGCKITCDGVSKEYKKVWLAPMMKGKYFGGGMIPNPAQDRNGDKVSLLVWHDTGKLKTLINFPKIFTGAHVNLTKCCDVFTGDNITVEYVKPCAAQVDGETILSVSKVEVRTK